MTDKVKRAFPYVYFVVLFMLFIMFVYFHAFHDNPPLDVYGNMRVTPNEVYAGDEITIEAVFCKYTEVSSDPLTTYWQRTTDGLIRDVTERQTSISGTGCNTSKILLTVPLDLEPGEWQRVNRGTYQVNIFAERTVEWRSEPFTVLEKPVPLP